MKKILYVLTLGFVLALTSCGDQYKAKSLVKDFLNENLTKDNDCSYERFSNLTPTAMIDIDQVKSMRKEMSTLPYIKKDISYNDNAITETLLYIRATYKLTDKEGKQQELTQTFYMDKALTHVVAFKQN